MLPSMIAKAVESTVGSRVLESTPVGGGCIANTTRVRCENGVYFVKWAGGEGGNTFEAEAAGLARLRSAGSRLVIPEPLFAQSPALDQPGMLIETWIETGRRHRDFWNDFGEGLAELHRHQSDLFGLDADNFIGRLPQKNGWEHLWPTFFRKYRLQPQVDWAKEGGKWASTVDSAMDRLLARLEDLLPHRPEPSILHGDLWSGNFMTDFDNRPVLFDPAVYYGHRECDLAMAELFGGFDRRFFDSYSAAWPLERGYEERRDIYNLYHLINHLNHFGGGYAASVDRILRKF